MRKGPRTDIEGPCTDKRQTSRTDMRETSCTDIDMG